MAKVIYLILGAIVFFLLYSVHGHILTSLSTVFNIDVSYRTYTLPVVIIICLSFLTQSSYLISIELYSYIYFIATSYLGGITNMYFASLIYRILSKFIFLYYYFGVFGTLFVPTCLSLYGGVNARTIRKEVVQIKSPHYTKDEKTVIAHGTDLHGGANYQKGFVNKIVDKLVTEIQPDIVVITGDLVDSSLEPKAEWLIPFLKLKVPILYITGNHEELIGKDLVLQTIKKGGGMHIGNNLKGYIFNEINFIGIDYEYDLNKRGNEAEIAKNKVNVLLTHVPFIKAKDLYKYNILIHLCGHTHGGQMFPLHITSYLSSTYFRGLYAHIGRFVFVSNGIGTTLFPMRIGSDSQIGVIHIEKSD